LSAGNTCDIASMGFENKTKVLLLVPNVDATVGTSRVADTILIKCSAVEFSLGVLLSKCTIFVQFLRSISWVPELNRSRGNSNKLEIIWFLGPLNVEDGVSTSRECQKHLLSLYIVNVHVVIVALIYGCHISLTWTDGKSSDTFG